MAGQPRSTGPSWQEVSITSRRQVGRHTLDFFCDAKVALERESFAAGRADAGGNTFIA
jgi:hypothetical protein